MQLKETVIDVIDEPKDETKFKFHTQNFAGGEFPARSEEGFKVFLTRSEEGFQVFLTRSEEGFKVFLTRSEEEFEVSLATSKAVSEATSKAAFVGFVVCPAI